MTLHKNTLYSSSLIIRGEKIGARMGCLKFCEVRMSATSKHLSWLLGQELRTRPCGGTDIMEMGTETDIEILSDFKRNKLT